MIFKSLVPALVLAASTLQSSSSLAQSPKLEFPAPSPACTLRQRVGLTDVEIVYSRPSMKGRPIFGGLVPFGTVWRTGANAATKITFSTPVKFNGTEVPAGSYALYTIPGETEWTIILNQGIGQSGTQYNEKADVVRFKAAATHLSTTIETFTIEFNRIRDDGALLNLVWENTVVPIRMDLDLTSKLLPQIEQVMSGSDPKKPYFQAAMFYYDHDQDLQKAKQWVEAAIKEREAYYIVHLKAKILAKLGDKAGALAAANRSIELARQAKDSGYVKLNEDLIAGLK